MYGYIYLTKDLETGLIYIGQKKSDRFLDKKYLGSGTTIRTLLGSGATADRFEIRMIDTADSSDELNQKESYWINAYDSMNPRIGYNRCLGGITNAGFTQSDYQKGVVSTYMKNRVIGDETRQKMSNSAKSRVANRVTNGGYAWMNNFDKEIMVSSDDVMSKLDDGFVFGRLEKSDEYRRNIKSKYSNSTYMVRGEECKLIPNSEVDFYKDNGWVVGRNCYTDNRAENIKKSKSGTIRMIHPETLQVKYIKPDATSELLALGFVPYTEYKKKTP